MAIQELYNENKGFAPLLITEQWQLAQLNYSREQSPGEIKELEMHLNTDETFTLLEGKAFLIAANEIENLEMIWLKKGRTYNIPKGVWHNIAMMEESSVLIAENANTHVAEKPICALPVSVQKKIQKFGQVGGLTNERNDIA